MLAWKLEMDRHCMTSYIGYACLHVCDLLKGAIK